MERRLKRYCALIIAFACLLCVSACGGKDDYSAQDLSEKILKLCPEELTWSQLTAQQTVNYYSLSDDLLHDFSVYISDQDDRYDTVAVFSFNNKDERAALSQSIANGIKSNAAAVKAVNDTEYKKIQNRLVMEYKDKLIFVISDNVKDITDMLTELGAKTTGV